MNTTLRITHVSQVPCSHDDARTGLLAYLTATINGRIRIDGLALRRTGKGKIIVTFPMRRDGVGRCHPIVEPLDDATRLDLERQILEHLELERRR